MATSRSQRDARRQTVTLDRIGAREIAEAARSVAERFASGGTMWCAAPGAAAHARHVAVEFVHPVVVGKPGLPAISIDESDLATAILGVARPGDVVVVIGPSCADVESARRAASDRGALPVWIGHGKRPSSSSPGPVIWLDDADEPLARSNAAAYDGRLVRQYHLLWELTHVCLEHGVRSPHADAADAAGRGASDFLYPFLSRDEADPAELLDDLVESAITKADQSAALRVATLDHLDAALEATATGMSQRFASGGRLFTFGNGGSSTDADVLANLFAHPPLGPDHVARSLVDDAAVLTALSNDVGYDLVFARQLMALAQPDDIALGVSTSGDSRNLLAAFGEARRRGLLTVGLAGSGGGAMAVCEDIDHLLLIDSDRVHRIQETQAAVGYELWCRVVDPRERRG